MTKAKILIVEDEWIVADDLRERMIDLGFNVLEIVSSGEEAIEMVKKNKPHLVFMDIQLDGKLDGIETGKQIQSFGRIPIVFISAFMDADSRGKEPGNFYFVNKPFEEKELQRVVKKALKNHSV